MECFSHSGTPAVGVCKTCSKALCKSCGIDLGVAIACCEACAKEATDLHEMNQRGKRIYGIGVTRPKLASGVIVWLLFGTLFFGAGIFITVQNQSIQWFLILFGVASFAIAGLAHRRAKDIGLQC